MSNIGAVIGWKFNHQAGMETRDNKITVFPGGIPSQSDQDAWTAEYEAHLAATAYREKRAAEYPAVGDQLDDLYHKGAFSDAMAAQLKAVKDKYAKPE
tara:strand:- start:243 stop:536 length:294 start_codon:yes stop_codon:yes gene_type:complete